MKVRSFRLANLRNDEHFQFGEIFKNLVVKTGADMLKIAPQFAVWQSLYAQEDVALKKILKSNLTHEIQEADKTRDDLFRALVDHCNSSQKHFDPAVRAAAGRLQVVFDTYGNVAKKPLSEETSALYNLLEDLKGVKFSGDVAAAGLSAWLPVLETANNAVQSLFEARSDENAARTDLVLREVRTQVDAAYTAIVEILEARTVLDPSDDLFGFIHRWNVDVQKYEDIVDNRYGRSAANRARAALADAAATANARAAAEITLAIAQATADATAALVAADPSNTAARAAADEAAIKLKKIQAEIDAFVKEATA